MLFELNEYVDCLMSILTAEKVFRDPVRQHMIDCSVKWSVEFTSQNAYIGLTLRYSPQLTTMNIIINIINTCN